jgi:creatinine amidohydrolase
MKRRGEVRMQFLRPGEIVARLKAAPVVYVPFGPLEWHGPHMPYGTDPLNAENVALGACRKTGGVVWPTQFWGTERERRPEQLKSLGFAAGKYVVGMDFPKNILPSSYCPEEIFAVVAREILREVRAVGARLAVIVNGHGGENHIAVLLRLETEFNNTTDLRVFVRVAAPRDFLQQGSGEHAARLETSVIMSILPECVDLKALPPVSRPMKYTDWAVVDGPGFDGKAKGNGYLTKEEDPRRTASAGLGKRFVARTVEEVAGEVKERLKSIRRGRRR